MVSLCISMTSNEVKLHFHMLTCYLYIIYCKVPLPSFFYLFFLFIYLLFQHKLESRWPGEISITSHMQMTPPYGKKWRGTKKPLDESEWKSWLKAQHSENEDHGIQSHRFMANRWGKTGNSVRLYFGGAPKSLQMVTAAMKLKDAYSLEGNLWPT